MKIWVHAGKTDPRAGEVALDHVDGDADVDLAVDELGLAAEGALARVMSASIEPLMMR